MIIDLPDTTTSAISKSLVKIREEGGVVALGRVLTLVIATAPGGEEEAIEAANDASREHPMRVIVVSTEPGTEDTAIPARLDAEIRVGGDAGASDVIILRACGAAARDEESLVMGLLLPDAPVVTWWPGLAPQIPGRSALGRIAQRRITDASSQPDPQGALAYLQESYLPGDADFAWTRLTLWRAQLAAVLDQPPYEPVTHVRVTGSVDSPSTTLLAAWLRMQLGAETAYELAPADAEHQGIHGVVLERASGRIELIRDQPGVARLRQPGQPDHDVALPRRSLRDCLADELRRLDPDELWGDVITQGIDLIAPPADAVVRA
ncbi:glucose-6-phosphate dehydrogenase assembly protein OpcA [Agromyces archimandritae]|uniref:Glucose-6-phosphate dehydrogenase assembly protein OpcA n=1 Tax=Agromyces archimandritae TaxID=2781962 RepID=A0A975FM58_9MICO|nr:glucose-6-phosphate dehydrogenase assembly protein OpcA [Agromyces archimandritae]QTX04659.1 glucose-6-phosphate dehydrogenase assembly protein OpcA [Agromyces archimandritae]